MQEMRKFFKRFTPVAEPVFLFAGHLGKGLFIPSGIKTGS